MPTAKDLKTPTRQRVLESACEVFAEKGFHDATVQEICERAGANIASVNYYFRDKESLYGEAWRYTMEAARDKHGVLGEAPGHIPPEEQLYQIFLSRIQCIHDDGLAGGFPKLLARELLKPTPALEDIVLQVLQPQLHRIGALVAELIGPGATPEQIRGCTMSIVAQFAFLNFSRPVREVLHRLHEQHHPGQKGPSVEELARHMTDFSLAGIRHYRDQNSKAEEDANPTQ